MFNFLKSLFSKMPLVGRLSNAATNGLIKEAVPAFTMAAVSSLEKGSMTISAGIDGIGEFYKSNNR